MEFTLPLRNTKIVIHSTHSVIHQLKVVCRPGNNEKCTEVLQLIGFVLQLVGHGCETIQVRNLEYSIARLCYHSLRQTLEDVSNWWKYNCQISSFYPRS